MDEHIINLDDETIIQQILGNEEDYSDEDHDWEYYDSAPVRRAG